MSSVSSESKHHIFRDVPNVDLYTSKNPRDYIFFCAASYDECDTDSGGVNPGVFSNWFDERKVESNTYDDGGHVGLDGHVYWCVEQEMMYGKAKLFGDQNAMKKILGEKKSPLKLKKHGRKVKNYDDAQWSQERYAIVLNACLAKFLQHDKLRKILINTGNKIIVEAAWYDKVWGVGFSEWTASPEDGGHRGIKKSDDEFDAGPSEWPENPGNYLGRILMEVRDELANI